MRDRDNEESDGDQTLASDEPAVDIAKELDVTYWEAADNRDTASGGPAALGAEEPGLTKEDGPCVSASCGVHGAALINGRCSHGGHPESDAQSNDELQLPVEEEADEDEGGVDGEGDEDGRTVLR